MAIYEVQIPDVNDMDGMWANPISFNDKETALKFLKDTFGADDQGRICLLAEHSDDEY